jgi:EAL domain-containing protein (putative c-di-GMP-specific phosphodiesterase class I)
VNLGQGYLFAKPVPLDQFLQLAPKFSTKAA